MFQAQESSFSTRPTTVAQLYENLFDRVARYIAVRMGDVHEAEILASEVFARALRAVGSFKDTGAPMEAWIFKIVHNLAANYLRDKSRRPSFVPLDDIYSIAGKEDPGEEIERKDVALELRTAMQELTEAQRKVLALRFGNGLTSQQIGKILGKRPGAVREMQSAAVKKLRQVLEATGAASTIMPVR